LRLDARGGNRHSGFAVVMPGITPAQINSGTVALTRNDVVMPNPQLSGVSGEGGGVVFNIFADASLEMPTDGIGDANASCLAKGFRNTGQGCLVNDFVRFKLSFDLNFATATFPLPPYDPFIFNTLASGNTAANSIARSICPASSRPVAPTRRCCIRKMTPRLPTPTMPDTATVTAARMAIHGRSIFPFSGTILPKD
jgi:LruC domain-containing protein